MLVHFKNISTPNLPKIFAHQFADQFFVSSSRASGSAAGLKPGGRVRCLALSHAWVCPLLSQDHGPRHFLAPSSSAQDLALQPNFAKALNFRSYATLAGYGSRHGYPLGLVKEGPNQMAAVYVGMEQGDRGGRARRLWVVVPVARLRFLESQGGLIRNI